MSTVNPKHHRRSLKQSIWRPFYCDLAYQTQQCNARSTSRRSW